MTQYVSECPNCHTSFSISDEQLDVADGMVRCGSCLHIYNAREQIANASAEQTPVASSDNEDDWLIDDNFVYGKDTENDENTENEAPLFQSDAPLYDDESWETTATNEKGELEFSEDILNFDEQDFSDDALFKDFEELEKSQSQKSSEDWAEDLLKEEDENSPENAAFQDILAQLDTNYKNIPIEQATLTAEPSATQESNSSNNFNLGAANATGNKPSLQFKKENHWLNITKKLGIVALTGLLITQFVYYNFEQLSVNSKTRPIMSVICKTSLCSLPEQRDINKIKTTNLVVRNHPTINESLKVDLILSNRAQFEQAFPKLTLQFRDLKGKIIAGRTFIPHNYLSGALKNQHLMPINQPIHLEFEIVDPGQDAVNYEIIASD